MADDLIDVDAIGRAQPLERNRRRATGFLEQADFALEDEDQPAADLKETRIVGPQTHGQAALLVELQRCC